MGRIAAAEADLKAKSGHRFGNPWADIASATQANRNLYFARYFALPRGDLFNYAITLVQATSERAKPNAERLPEYSESALPLVEKRLLDARPIYPWLDQLNLEWSLSKAREYLGADDPETRLLLGKDSPEALSARLVAGTKLADPAYRARVEAQIPMGRIGEPDDCVGAALLLCSEAGRYITGVELFVDGGWHAT